MQKQCTRCKEYFPATDIYFQKHNQCKDGLRPECKSCSSKWNKNYYTLEKEKILIARKKYYKNNKKKVNARNKRHFLKNRDKRLLQMKQYNILNPITKEGIKKQNKNKLVKNSQMIHELKINGCAICGYNKCDNSLCFHHTNPKDKITPVNSLYYRDNKKFFIEVNKCILLCKNCHGEIHELERKNKRM